eukprot:c22915_g1_i2 orf=220-1518(-)
MGCDMDGSDGLCLSQKLSQVRLHNHGKLELGVVPRPAEEALPALPEDESFCSQDFFSTPDFLTPVEQQFPVDFEGMKENVGSFGPPSKISPLRSKRPRPDATNVKQELGWHKLEAEPGKVETLIPEENGVIVSSAGFQTDMQGNAGYTLPNCSARLSSMRRHVLSPPCIRNPFLYQAAEDASGLDKRSHNRSHAHLTLALGANCLSRYREEFHEMQEIGRGNFSIVYKVLKRIDGCFYAVKCSNRQLRQDSERRQSLMEVQAMAAIGFHENVVRYHTAWFENDHLYIQMELCDGSLRNWKYDSVGPSERFLLEVMRQTFKLGDFGRATRLDGSISIEEGDGRYMPLEIINDDYSHLPKADMFALGASIYELARNLPLPSSGAQFQLLRQGKLPLLPGLSVPLQSILKGLMHPNPAARPNAQDLLKHPIFSML